LIDAQHTHTPFYSWPRMTVYLRRRELPINQKRGLRLMQLMGLAAICPRPKTTRVAEQVKIYPYLLSGLTITRQDQVWRANITSPENLECEIRLQR
jgi:putative transposase